MRLPRVAGARLGPVSGTATCPNEMVPLQIDLAIGMGRYLRATFSNPARARSLGRACTRDAAGACLAVRASLREFSRTVRRLNVRWRRPVDRRSSWCGLLWVLES